MQLGHGVLETHRIDCKRDMRRNASNYRIVRVKLQQSSEQTEAATRGLAISSNVHVLAYLSLALYLFLHGTLSAPFAVPVYSSRLNVATMFVFTARQMIGLTKRRTVTLLPFRVLLSPSSTSISPILQHLNSEICSTSSSACTKVIFLCQWSRVVTIR